MMNSDEIQKLNELNNMVPQIGHAYKKSMINPTLLRPTLEIQLPEHEQEQMYASLRVK
jgi:hypothetical protein